jgi:hypothetical protein
MSNALPHTRRQRSVFLKIARVLLGICLLLLVTGSAITIFDLMPGIQPASLGYVIGQATIALLLGALVLFLIDRVRR